MSMATFFSAGRCSLLWWAQKSNSPELGSRTRTYACAPHRSHRSSAVSGLVGAIAPVTSPSSSHASGYCVRLAPVCCYVSGHLPSQRADPLGGTRPDGGTTALQHSTTPAVTLPYVGGCTPQAKTALSRGKPLQASALAGDHTTVREVTGEVPVRFMRCIPPDGRHDTFDRKYPALTVRLHGLMSGSRLPARSHFRPLQAGPPVQSSRSGGARKTGKPAWCRPGSRWGTLPFECGSPRLPHKHSRGEPPPVPPLTETVRATTDPKAPTPQAADPKAQHQKTQPRARQDTARREAQPVADATDSYSAKHLSVLEGLDAVRKRPGMYIGSTDGRGLQHCLWEIFDNSVDEALGGYCTRVEVILHADGSAEVSDNGRGIPVDNERKTKLSGVELVMTRLHAGGKFGGGSYTASGGLHGVGASVVNALSARLDIEVDRDGQTWAASFRRGVTGEFAGDGPEGGFTRRAGLRKIRRVAKKVTGSRVRFWPDKQVFVRDARFSVSALAER